MTFWQRRQQADQLRAIPLELVLPLCGGQRDPYDKHKWHTAAGVLSVTGAKFMNWNGGWGGGGAIDLVIHLHHLDFKAAVDWLAQHFPGSVPSLPPAPIPQLQFQLPPSDPGKLDRVLQYLVDHRKIAPVLLDPLIGSGTLYADTRANAVFLLLGKEKLPVGAELRGTTARPWHGLAPGSQKDLGCFAVPAEPLPAAGFAGQPVILCESAIDALSCVALHPQSRCLSTAGARPNPTWLKPLLAQTAQVYCGFDADPTGDQMADAMMALHPGVQRLRPSAHDWNDVLKAEA
jgi:hypothetical protein